MDDDFQGYPIVLTADRTLMSEYGGSIFLGFSAVVPTGLVPPPIYFRVFCPPIEVNHDGSVPVSPCGIRKIESILLDAGFARNDVVVAHPEHLDKVIGPATKVLGITENDPLGIGPATSTFTNIFGGDAYMKVKFRELLDDPIVKKYHPHIVVGGPGAWQLGDSAAREGLNIDTVVLGEGELVVPDLFGKIVAGEKVPNVVLGEVTPVERIAKIRAPAVDGLVEIARGCGRGCDFCIPTMAKYRCRTIPDIVEDVRTTIAGGRQPILHSEDVVRYGATSVAVDEEKLVELFKAVKAVSGVERISISHFALASVASSPEAIARISEIMGLTEKNWLGGQTGIETGSVDMMRQYMIGKCKPFKPEEWPETVQEGFKICQKNNWVPCGTIVMGLPGEKPADVLATDELVLKLNNYRSLVVPLFFVATAEFVNGEHSFGVEDMTKDHTKLFLDCWEHNLNWAPKILSQWSGRSMHDPITRGIVKLAFRFGIAESKEIIRMCRRDYDCDIHEILEANKRGEIHLFSTTMRALANRNADC